MTVHLYYDYSDTNVVNKNIELKISLSGTLRDECSITDPTILIEYNGVFDFTYMMIPEFSRYYYITSIVAVRSGLWAVTGHVDVLMSFKEYFYNCYGIVSRQENLYNLYLDDDRLKVTSKRNYVTKTFQTPALTSTYNVVLILAGGAT